MNQQDFKPTLTAEEILNYMNRNCPWKNDKARSAYLNNFSTIDRNKHYVLKEIDISSIVVYFKPHSKRNLNKYIKMIKKGSLPPPIVLGNQYSNQENIKDGLHRLEAMKACGQKTIFAYVETD